MKRFPVMLAVLVAALSSLTGAASGAATASVMPSRPASSCTSPSGAADAQTITLAPGCSRYLYVGSTDGGQPMSSVSWRQDLKLTALYSSNLSVSIGHSASATGHYTSASGNYGIAAVGTAQAPALRAKAKTTEIGPGCPGCGTTAVPGPSLNLTFSVPSTSTVLILIGGEGTGTLSFSGFTATELQNQTYGATGGYVLASVAIYQATLPAGNYTAQFTSTTTLNNSGESLGAAAYLLP